MSEYQGWKCPVCGGSRLQHGEISTLIMYKPKDLKRASYVMRAAFACLDCGYVGHYLNPKDLADLQHQVANPSG